MTQRSKSILGRQFGRWTVIERAGVNQHRQALWLCRCACGQERSVATASLICGQSRSCGCLQVEASSSHGLSHMRSYRAWNGVVARCTRQSSNRFESYAGRGITVCERWLASFEAFLADMGECPDGMSIERIDNDRGYEPGNCRWATVKEQARNRRSSVFVEHNGERLTIAEWAERYGIPYKRLWKQVRVKHMSMAAALVRAA